MPIKIPDHSPWRSQVLVTKALLHRELVTRFGKYKLGAIWAFADPLLSVIVIGVILGPLIGRSSGDIPYPFFLLCGFMLLNMLSGSMSAGIGAAGANKGLMVFKKVQAFDPFVARFIFIFLINASALIVFCIVAYWIGIDVSVQRIPEAAICIILTWLIGSGLGLFLGIATLKFNELEKIVGYIQRPLLFLSCVLYPLDAIPPQYAHYLLYNPLVHTIEYMRMMLFPSYVANGVNLYYPTAWVVAAFAVGITAYRNNRHFLTQQ